MIVNISHYWEVHSEFIHIFVERILSIYKWFIVRNYFTDVMCVMLSKPENKQFALSYSVSTYINIIRRNFEIMSNLIIPNIKNQIVIYRKQSTWQKK